MWTKEQYEEMQNYLNYVLKGMGDSLDRARKAREAVIMISRLLQYDLDRKVISELILNLQSIKDTLLKKEEMSIFSWEEINKKTLEFDKRLELFEKQQLKIDKHSKDLLKKVKLDKKIFYEGKKEVKLDKEFHKSLEQLKSLHKHMDLIVSEVLKTIERGLKKEDCAHLHNQLNILDNLAKDEEKIYKFLSKNTYVHLKITRALGRNLFLKPRL